MAEIFIPGRPLTMNRLYNSIRSPAHRAAEVRKWRQLAHEAWYRTALAHEAWYRTALAELAWPLSVVATPHYPTLANRPDVAACHPAVKAAVDGLMDAGLLPDDNPDVVLEYVHRAPVMRSERGLGLHVEVVSLLAGRGTVRPILCEWPDCGEPGRGYRADDGTVFHWCGDHG